MKVLIVSHNPVSPQGNMGKTLQSLFSGFDKEELCQLYIYPTVPSRECCGSYYRITDKDVAGALLNRRPAGGEIPRTAIRESQGLYEDPADAKLYKNRKNKSALRRFARDGLWKLGQWYGADLKAWLRRQQPEAVFVAPGPAFFLYGMALRISEDLGLPLVCYLSDDYYFLPKPKGVLEGLRHSLLQKKMETLLNRSAHLAVISRELQEAYGARFLLPTTVVMTGEGIPPAEAPAVTAQPKALCYFGNLGCGRHRSLEAVARALEEINRACNVQYTLKIYTSEQNKEVLQPLLARKCVKMVGFVTGPAFEKELKKADILLHTEDFTPENRQRVGKSLSTKLADYLASGVPVLAYGPAEIASMRHLQRNGCALCVTEPGKLRAGIQTLLEEKALRRSLAEKGLETAKKYHNSGETGRKIREILENTQGRNLKILQVNSLLDHQSTGKITALVHETLRQQGYRITTVYGRGPGAKGPGIRRLCPEWYGKYQGLRVKLGGLPYGGCELSTWKFRNILKQEKPDLVHLQCINGHFLNVYKTVEWLKKQKIPTAVSLHAEFLYTAGCGHAFDCQKWKTGCGKCRQGGRRSWEKMRKAFLGFEEKGVLLPVSDWVGQRAAQGEILKNIPGVTLHNPVDPTVFAPGKEEKEANGVLYVTANFDVTPGHPKGAWYLVELAGRMPNVTFYVAGRGEKPKNLPKNVVFCGEVTDQTHLATLYRRAKVTLITSRGETFSMPCAESLCCGTPVVGFRAGGPEAAMPRKYSEFVEFGDLEALEGAVRRWLEADAAPSRVAAAARERFAPEVIGKELVKIYEELCR